MKLDIFQPSQLPHRPGRRDRRSRRRRDRRRRRSSDVSSPRGPRGRLVPSNPYLEGVRGDDRPTGREDEGAGGGGDPGEDGPDRQAGGQVGQGTIFIGTLRRGETLSRARPRRSRCRARSRPRRPTRWVYISGKMFRRLRV